MKRLWLLFSQTTTVLLAAYFVVATLKPQWIGHPSLVAGGCADCRHLPNTRELPRAGSLRLAAQKASAAVVSINTSKAANAIPIASDPWFRFFFGDQGDEAHAKDWAVVSSSARPATS
jgi:serine protease DegQ